MKTYSGFFRDSALRDFIATTSRIFTLASDDEMDKIDHVGPKPAVHPFVGDQIVGPDDPLSLLRLQPPRRIVQDP